MNVLDGLWANMLPLYGVILIGWLVSRQQQIHSGTLGSIALFALVPMVVFGFVIDLDFQPAYLALPLLVLTVECVLAVIIYRIGKRVYGDARANLVTMCAVMGNSGYFGVPIVMLVFGAEQVGVYLMMMLGTTIFQATGGYYLAARGKFSVEESLKRLVRFPSLYAIAAALGLNFAGIGLPDALQPWKMHAQGAFIVLGMLIVGTALPGLRDLRVAPRFVGLALFGKYLLWPAAMLAITLTDRHITGFLPHEAHWLLMIIAIVPPGANIPAFALHLDLLPEKAATTVLIGTLAALAYIPACLWLMTLLLPL